MKRLLRGAAMLAVAAAACRFAADIPVLRELILGYGRRLPALLILLASAGAFAAALQGVLSRAGFPDRRIAPSHGGWMRDAEFPLVLTACMVPLLACWLDARSGDAILSGLLPVSDARDYYKGAIELLRSGKLGDWSLRRPLNASLLAVRLALSGGGIRGALVIQAMLLGTSLFLLSRAVRRDLGWPSGLAVFVFPFIFAQVYLHLCLSEILGLTLGALGFSLLWEAARRGDIPLLSVGAFAETAALHARAGPFLMLPALALWALAAWDGGRRARVAAAGAIILGFAAATLFNVGLAAFHGGRPGNGHGNFYFTLYGISTGDPGWRRVYDDYPQIWKMRDAESNAFIREKTIAQIRRHPGKLVEGLAAGWGNFLSRLPEFAGRFASDFPVQGRSWFYFPLLLAGLPVYLWRFGLRRETTMVLSLSAGVLASVPVLWVDGGTRVFAVAVPILAMLPAFALAGLRPRDGLYPETRGSAPTEGFRCGPAVALLSVLMVSAVIGPPVARTIFPMNPPAPRPSGFDPSLAVIRTDAPSIRLLPSATSRGTFVPEIDRGDFMVNLMRYGNRELRRIPERGALVLARDWNPGPFVGRYILVVGPGEIASGRPGYVLVKGAYAEGPGVLTVSEWHPVESLR
ncbi:MAG TPA: hypothetical protein VGK27_02020 [Candidatus Deferrimicrobiaceae bacterium]|jgi:hypothetical protein